MPQTPVETLAFQGDLSPADAAPIAFLPLSSTCRFHFTEADIPDGRTMAAFTAALRTRLLAGGPVLLVGPPQLLMHNLYRTGVYPHPLLHIEDMREDEAYG